MKMYKNECHKGKQMKMFGTIIVAMVSIFALTATVATGSGKTKPLDKTLSPYFMVRGGDPEIDKFPLKSTATEADIAGVIADVKVVQVYENTGKKAVEAIYVFPASTKASVYGMKMSVGERTITAEIKEREEAGKEYNRAKREGKSASLLEQQRPNVFQMSVANIMPGDVIKVELKYTEMLVPTDGVYEFVCPAVVGPRYSSLPESAAPESEKWVKNPYLREGESPSCTFDVKARISAGMPVNDVACASHKAAVTFDSPSVATVKLDPDEKHGGNRDFVLKYRLSGGNIQTGLLLYESGRENFFALMMQPPKRVEPDRITPREYIFIVDVSGSMHGFPLEITKQLLGNLISGLKETDMFNVVLFAGGSSLLSERSLPAGKENIQEAATLIDSRQGKGGTKLLPALNRALRLPELKNYARSVVIVTDGFVRVEKETFDVIRNNIGKANIFAFGIGSSVNRHLIEGMARIGSGEPFVVTSKGEAKAKAKKFLEYVRSPVLTGAKIDFGGFGVFEVEPPKIPDLFAQHPVVIMGKYRSKPKGLIKLSGTAGDGPFETSLDIAGIEPLDINSGIRYLWAGKRIAVLSGYNSVLRHKVQASEIRRLGLEYNLLTAYTSFVASDSVKRSANGQPATVKQPLPLPKGVSDAAVGGESAAARSIRSWKNGKKSMNKLKWRPVDTGTSDKKVSLRKSDLDMIPTGQISHDVSKMKVTGDLDKTHMQKMLEFMIDDFRKCYKRALRKNKAAGGAVLRIFFKAEGGVERVEFISRDINSSDLKSCILNEVKTWSIPGLQNGKNASVEYSLFFK